MYIDCLRSCTGRLLLLWGDDALHFCPHRGTTAVNQRVIAALTTMPEHSTESDMSLSDAVTWAHGWDRGEAGQQPQPQANHSAQRPEHHRHHHHRDDVPSQPRTPVPTSRKRKRTNTQGSSSSSAEARQPPQPITEAPIVPDFPPYEPGSRRGERRLRFIRHALSLPPDVSFAAIDAFLARNTSVLRHLAACTAPHPDWRLEDDDESRSNNDEQGGGGRSRCCVMRRRYRCRQRAPRV